MKVGISRFLKRSIRKRRYAETGTGQDAADNDLKTAESDEKMGRRRITFTKQDTRRAKGIAIIMMLMHHLWGFPKRRPTGKLAITGPFMHFTLNEKVWFETLGKFGKLCVPIFMFFVGFGLYKQYMSGKFYISRKILKIYREFWKVFIIFVPIGFIFFRKQAKLTPYSRAFRHFDLNIFILNFWGIDVSRYNAEWWFVMAFVIGCVFGYLYILATKRIDDLYTELAIVFVINLVMYGFLPIIEDKAFMSDLTKNVMYTQFISKYGTSTLFTGIVFAKYDTMDRLKRQLHRCPNWLTIVMAFVGTVSFIYLRTFDDFEFYDFIVTPFIIALMVSVVDMARWSRALFDFLGRHSENIWLTHSFYCYRFSPFVRIVYKSQNALIDLLVLLLLSIATSVVLNWIWSIPGRFRDPDPGTTKHTGKVNGKYKYHRACASDKSV